VSSDPLALRAVLIAGSKGYDVGAPLDAALGSLKEPAMVARLRGKELEELVGAGDRA